VSGSCDHGGGDGTDPLSLSEDEIYLVDAYVDIKRARSNYPHYPVVAESLFTVLDSTLDSDRIAKAIQDLNLTPDRWVVIFDNIEQKLRGQGDRSDPAGDKPESKVSEQSGG
jgi:hypothetical protein